MAWQLAKYGSTTAMFDNDYSININNMLLCIGGPIDGAYVCHSRSLCPGDTFTFRRSDCTYQKRTYKNPTGQQFTVLALSTLKGHEVLHLLSTKYYYKNPLKEVMDA